MNKLLGSFLDSDRSFFPHSTDDGNKAVSSSLLKLLNFCTNLPLRHLDIVLLSSVCGHKVEETVIRVEELIFSTADIRDIHVVSRWAQIFKLLASEDINGDQVDLCVTVLAGLGGTHFNNFAGPALNNNVTVLSEGGTLHREGGGRTSRCLLELVVVLFIVSHVESIARRNLFFYVWDED